LLATEAEYTRLLINIQSVKIAKTQRISLHYSRPTLKPVALTNPRGASKVHKRDRGFPGRQQASADTLGPFVITGGRASLQQEETHMATAKEQVHRLIIERLAADLAVFLAAARSAHEAATHEENIPDNKYDTLSLEASYVAQGQANRAQDLKRSLHAYQTMTLMAFGEDAPIRLSALVHLEGEDGERRALFIGPQEGGMKLKLNGEEIMVITAASPLGTELIGKRVGDQVNIGKRDFEIVEVS